MRTLIAVVILLVIFVIFHNLRLFNILSSENLTDCSKLDIVVFDSGVAGPTIGMVGSVHGNEPAGSYTLTKMVAEGAFKPRKGKIIIIRQANPCGLLKNTRENPITTNDINRQFTENGGLDESSMRIVETLKPCDVILDFHEGWGFHLETKASSNPFGQISVGSTLTPGDHKFWRTLAPAIVDKINENIADPLKRFSIIWNASCKIPSSLNCYAAKNDRPYMLIETSGQNNIQPMSVRVGQNLIIINMVLRAFDIQ